MAEALTAMLNKIGCRFYNRSGFVETGRFTHSGTSEPLIQMDYRNASSTVR